MPSTYFPEPLNLMMLVSDLKVVCVGVVSTRHLGLCLKYGFKYIYSERVKMKYDEILSGLPMHMKFKIDSIGPSG